MKLAALALLALPALAQAQATCRAYEYAELRDMPKDHLVTLYCEYFDSMVRMTKLIEAHGLGTRGGSRALNDGLRCGEETERIERILKSVHATGKPTC